MNVKKTTMTFCIIFSIVFFMHNAKASEELVIVGTGSGSSIIKAIGKAFSREHPTIRVVVPPSIGSSGGITAIREDKYLIGRIAKSLKKSDLDAGINQVPFARMPIVFFVNNTVALTSITPAQAGAIYSGKIRKWQEVSGGEGKIRVIRREEGDSSLQVILDKLPGFKDIVFTKRSKVTYSDPSTVETAAMQKNSIAFGTWPNVKTNNYVHPLALKNIPPTDTNYPCVGTLSVIFKEKNFSGAMREFVEFFNSPAAHKAIIKAGGLVVKGDSK